MIDVALASLIEDMIEKAGAEGVVEFWQRVGDNLAGRMGKEAYLGWTSFNVAVREARTAFSIEGEVTPLTDMAITDVDGDVVGYLYAMRQCCYIPTIFRTRFAVGRMSPADQAVTEEYNENVHDIAVCNFCVFHERRAGEYQRGPRPGAAPELRVRVRARPPRGAAQGGAVRCPPTPGCKTAIRSWKSRRICSSKTSRERSGSPG